MRRQLEVDHVDPAGEQAERSAAEQPRAERGAAHTSAAVFVPSGWGSESTAARRTPSVGGPSTDEPLSLAAPEQAGLGIKDLDTGRTIPFDQADILWQPLLVRDLDASILLPFSPDEGRAASSQEMLNPPASTVRIMSCTIEESMLPPPLSIPEFHMFKLKRKKRVEMFSACRRRDPDESGSVHFDVRWRDGPLRFTGRLELLTSPRADVQELAMYDDYINYYGFPRELGFIRMKRLDGVGEADCLLEVIIPRISADGSAAQFRVGAVPGQTMLSMFKRNRGAPRPASAGPCTRKLGARAPAGGAAPRSRSHHPTVTCPDPLALDPARRSARAHVRSARPAFDHRQPRAHRVAPPRRERQPAGRAAGEAHKGRRNDDMARGLHTPNERVPVVLHAPRAQVV